MFSGSERAARAFGPWGFRVVVTARKRAWGSFSEAHIERSPADLDAVERLDGPFRTGIICHRNKAITFACSGILVSNDGYCIDRTVRAEHLDQSDLLHIFGETNDE
jgi:hypothetical protein